MTTKTAEQARRKPVSARPRGPEQVRQALFEAAESLFGAKGPDAVSIRDIAAEANVNHGLVHHYIGGKDQLVHAVIARYAAHCRCVIDQSESALEAVTNIFDLIQNQPSISRIFAHLLLSGHPPHEIAIKDAGSSRLSAVLEHAGAGEISADAKLIGAVCIVLSFGWSLFEDFILYAVDYKYEAAEARLEIKKILDGLVRSHLNIT